MGLLTHQKKPSNTTGSKKNNQSIQAFIDKGRKSPLPMDIKPMLATLVDHPFEDNGWLYEIKWDGYRAVSYLYNGVVEIRSRNNLSFNDKYKPIAAALKDWKVNAVIDGEIVAMDQKGHANFQKLQNFTKNGGKAELAYYVFDLIWYEGKNLTALPLIERKKILKSILPKDKSVIRYSDHVEEKGKPFFDVAISQGLEGVMAKKMDSEYITGFRSRNWLKIKNNHQLEAIICGYTRPRRSRKHFGAIIIGKYFGKELKYIGHSGSGFNDEMLSDLFRKLRPLATDKCPFRIEPKTNMPVTWVKPKLVCEIKFSEWTDEKVLRHPIFVGLREDKQALGEKDEKIVQPPKKRKK
ncbi:MAG: non-homologous end-joining DNA ligase [Bacteroidetes bacterium]|nr:non-homologous end-joining DNA ligase [Bacteroidota bacterium]